MSPRGDRPSEIGESLIELLATIAILGLAAGAILGGMALSARVSGIDRDQATATREVRNFAESIEADVAATPTGYNPNGVYSYTAASGYAATIETRQCISAASAESASPTWSSCPQSPDGGVQRLKLRVRANKDNSVFEELWVIVRKPCATAVSC